MKKISKMILAFFVGISLVACSVPQDDFKEVDITVAEIQEKIDNKEDFVMIVERDECSFCEAIEEYINQTEGEHPGITLYKLDSTDFGFTSKDDGSQTLDSSTDEGKAFLEIAPYFYYTPTMYVFKDGKITSQLLDLVIQIKLLARWLDAPIDFDTAETQDLWEFISQ